jgi:hypothetical protein
MAETVRRWHPAGIFLIIFATIIVLVIAGFLWIQANPIVVLRLSFTPSAAIADESYGPSPDYAQHDNWAARPELSSTAKDIPAGITSIAQIPEADVFFIYPTTYFGQTWNASLDDVEANRIVDETTLKNVASSFNLAGQIYAPKYRQATFGSFFDDTGQGDIAIERARQDVYAAFDHYINNINDGRPFILAGHSQGALHALFLLRDRISGTDIADRMIAAYTIGWAVSIKEDLGALSDINACEKTTDTRCVISYQSFGYDGDVELFAELYEKSIGLTGEPKRRSKMLCTNPLTWTTNASASKDQNLGGIPLARFEEALSEPIEGLTGAKCQELGVLLLTEPPQGDWREYMMAGENYHVYDYNLFYMNIRENAAERANAWLKANQ